MSSLPTYETLSRRPASLDLAATNAAAERARQAWMVELVPDIQLQSRRDTMQTYSQRRRNERVFSNGLTSSSTPRRRPIPAMRATLEEPSSSTTAFPSNQAAQGARAMMSGTWGEVRAGRRRRKRRRNVRGIAVEVLDENEDDSDSSALIAPPHRSTNMLTATCNTFTGIETYPRGVTTRPEHVLRCLEDVKGGMERMSQAVQHLNERIEANLQQLRNLEVHLLLALERRER